VGVYVLPQISDACQRTVTMWSTLQQNALPHQAARLWYSGTHAVHTPTAWHMQRGIIQPLSRHTALPALVCRKHVCCPAVTYHRWRLHLDVEHSVNLRLGAPSQLTAAVGSSSTHSAAACTFGSRVAVNTQIRSKDADSQLWVDGECVETAAAAQQTLASTGMGGDSCRRI
jgi:hypothetical protein